MTRSMRAIDWRAWALAAGLAALVASGWLALGWRAETQIERHTLRLLKAGEKRDWKRVTAMLAEDYADGWGNRRADAVAGASEAFAQFFWLTIEPDDLVVRADGETGESRAVIRLDGHGTGLAQTAIGRVNALSEPFVFQWRKESWKPWDWRLYSVAQPELRIRSDFYFP